MPFETITSFQNAKVKLAKKLRDKRTRDKEQLFIVDDARDLTRALQHGYEAAFVFYCRSLANDDDTALVQSLSGTVVYDINADIMAKASYRQNPGGIIAVMQQKRIQTAQDLYQSPPADYVLGLVNLAKPGNIGALLRTADAAGFSIILLIDTALDVYNPNIIRSSTGACFLQNLYHISTDEALNYLQTQGYQRISGHLAGQMSLFDVDFRQRSAVLLGAEDSGLPDIWTDHCDQHVKIPMIGHLSDSLNVSVSGAIFMYEALRQRQLNGDGN